MAVFKTITGDQIELTREQVDRVACTDGKHTKIYYDDNRKKAVVLMSEDDVNAALGGEVPAPTTETNEPTTDPNATATDDAAAQTETTGDGDGQTSMFDSLKDGGDAGDEHQD